MLTLELSPELLGRTHFAISPLAEATLSLRLLGEEPRAHPHTPWLRRVRSRLSAVDMELLEAVTPVGPGIASTLIPAGDEPDTQVEDQLARLAQVDPDLLRRELTSVHVYGAAGPPPIVAKVLGAGPHGMARLAETLYDYWAAALAPYWSRMRVVLEDDVTHRVAGMLAGGLYELLTDLHPEVSIEGDRLSIDKPHLPDDALGASTMTLSPSIFVWPSLVSENAETDRMQLTYPARGIARVWERTRFPDHRSAESFSALLGRSRATILARTSVPVSTTHLARELGQSAASVNEHLSVLLRTGLVSRRRVGRSVLYRQTQLAEAILAG